MARTVSISDWCLESQKPQKECKSNVDIEPLSPDWFLGFLEGEGCFNISFGVRHSIVYPRATMVLTQQERNILEKAKVFLTTYGIRSRIYWKPDNFLNLKNKPLLSHDIWILTVIDMQSIMTLARFLSGLSWHSNKIHDFEKWKQCIDLIHLPHSKENLIRISEIAEMLNSNKGKRKWTPQFIEKNCHERQGKVRLDKIGLAVISN